MTAPVAPVACVLGAEVGATVAEALAAYAAGFEAMGSLARASHPALYDRGWHPTAVCGVVGAAVAAARLLECETGPAVRAAILSAGGLLAAFGSDGKSLQVGFAAAAGMRAARLAASGAQVPASVTRAFEDVYGATWADPDDARSAIEDNWIKAYPCCLQTHSSIEVAEQARAAGLSGGPFEVTVHPVSRRAAPYDHEVSNGLQAKFSIPYTVAYTLLYGAPGVRDFMEADKAACALAAHVTVVTDAGLEESEARLLTPDGFGARVVAAIGSPLRPLSPDQLEAKVRDLCGDALEGVFADLDAPAKVFAAAARLL